MEDINIKQVSANVQRQGSKSLRTGIRELATCNQSFSQLFTTRRRHYKIKWSLSDRFTKYATNSTHEDEDSSKSSNTEVLFYETIDRDKAEDKENEPTSQSSVCDNSKEDHGQDSIYVGQDSAQNSVCVKTNTQNSVCTDPNPQSSVYTMPNLQPSECFEQKSPSSMYEESRSKDSVLTWVKEDRKSKSISQDSAYTGQDIENECSSLCEKEKVESDEISVISSTSVKGVDDMAISNGQDSGNPIVCSILSTHKFEKIKELIMTFPSFTAPISDSPSPPPPPPPPITQSSNLVTISMSQPAIQLSSLVSPSPPPSPPPPPPPPPKNTTEQIEIFSRPPILSNICSGSFNPGRKSFGYPMTGVVQTPQNYLHRMLQNMGQAMLEQDYPQNTGYPLHQQNSNCAGQAEFSESHTQALIEKSSPAVSYCSSSPSSSNLKLIEEHPYAPPIVMRNIMKSKENRTILGNQELLEECPKTQQEDENIRTLRGETMCEKQNSPIKIGAELDLEKAVSELESKNYVDILKNKVRHASGSSVSSTTSTDSQMSGSSSKVDDKDTSKKASSGKNAKAFHGRTLLKGDVTPRNIPLTPLYKRKPFTSKGKPTERPVDPRVRVKLSSLDQRCSELLGESQEKQPMSLAVPKVIESELSKCDSPHKMLEDILHKSIKKEKGLTTPSLKRKLQENRDLDSKKILVKNRITLLSSNLKAGNKLEKDIASGVTIHLDGKEQRELDTCQQLKMTASNKGESENFLNTNHKISMGGDSHQESPKPVRDEKHQGAQESLKEKRQNNVKNVQLRTKAATNLIQRANKGTAPCENDSSDFKDSDSDILVIDITGYSDFEESVARDQISITENERKVEMKSSDSEGIDVQFGDRDTNVDSRSSPEKMENSADNGDKIGVHVLKRNGNLVESNSQVTERASQNEEKEESLEEGEMVDSEESNKEVPKRYNSHHHHHHHRHRSRHRRRRSPRHRHTSSHDDKSHQRHHTHHGSRSRSSLRNKRSKSPGTHKKVIDLTSGMYESASSDEESRSRSVSTTRTGSRSVSTRTGSRSRSDSRSSVREAGYHVETREKGCQESTRDRDYKTGTRDPGYQDSHRDKGYQTGTREPNYQAGHRDKGYHTGTREPNYQVGNRDRGYQTATHDSGYDAGTRNTGFQSRSTEITEKSNVWDRLGLIMDNWPSGGEDPNKQY